MPERSRPNPPLGERLQDTNLIQKALARAVREALLRHKQAGNPVAVWRDGLNTIAGWLGVTGYPPAVLFAVGLLFVVLVLLHYSTVISKLADQNTILAQRLAILEAKLRERG